MLGYIFGRILALMMILLAVSVIVFALMHSVPGGPFDERKGRLPPAAKANILKKYGLDQPVWKQYINYMSHAVRFDFGIPYQRPHTTVAKLISKSWAITVQVGLTTIVVAFGFGILAGIYAAYHQNSWVDTLVTFVSSLGGYCAQFRGGNVANFDLCRLPQLVTDGRVGLFRSVFDRQVFLYRLDITGDRLRDCTDGNCGTLHSG